MDAAIDGRCDYVISAFQHYKKRGNNSQNIQLRSVNDGFETQLRSMNVESSVQPYRQADAGGHMSSLSDSLPFSLLLHNGKGAAVIIILT